MGVLLIGYMLSQRLRLIGQATKSDAAYSAALHKAWFLACIANACRSYALLGTTSASINTSATIKAWSLAGIAKPAAHAHSLAPPHQVSPRGRQHRRLLELRRRRPSAGTPGRLIGCSRVRSLPAPAVETRTIQAAKAPRHMGSHLFRVVFAGSGITLPSRFSAPNNCAFSASR